MTDSSPMSRRGFLKLGHQKKSSREVAGAVRGLFGVDVKREVLRPPGALSEEAFLLTCTQCEACVKACPYDAIIQIQGSEGPDRGRPTIDPIESPCHYCEDFPCIAACEPKALQLKPDLLKMGKAVFHEEHCLVFQGQYCDYCLRSCPKEVGALIPNANKTPKIDDEACVGCGKCAYICVSQSGKALVIEARDI